MNVPIKTEPEILEDPIFQSREFVDEKSDEKTILSMQEMKYKPKQQEKVSIKIQPIKKKTTKKYKASSNLKVHVEDKIKEEFTPYLKKRFLEIFRKEGCTPQNVAKYANLYNVKIDDVNDYFDEAAREAQYYVYQECDSLSFSNITEWLQYLQATGVPQQCDYEAAIAMNAIANNEYHSYPKAMETINLKEIYAFLSNALLGLPQKPLNEASAKFLSNEFQNLINAANTDEADNNVRDMKRKIEYSLRSKLKSKFPNLDPLNTDNERLEVSCMRNVNH